uniref:peptidyl-prolyl cis-trans isomerase FKBP8 n=1 Tax=Ciona intestinalis TaxID=7719 RepID=UPI000180B85C|nr:peptidyl-prolyl cis-trans isomerase FKBP8 [Ciona intestinalis]|eukprot:XP_002119960.3 peptidyl-prolyl cis-trans isomerase FKBP8 [Ciona intestinalis]
MDLKEERATTLQYNINGCGLKVDKYDTEYANGLEDVTESDSDAEVEKRANDIVNDVIDSASMSLLSGGDFSLAGSLPDEKAVSLDDVNESCHDSEIIVNAENHQDEIVEHQLEENVNGGNDEEELNQSNSNSISVLPRNKNEIQTSEVPSKEQSPKEAFMEDEKRNSNIGETNSNKDEENVLCNEKQAANADTAVKSNIRVSFDIPSQKSTETTQEECADTKQETSLGEKQEVSAETKQIESAEEVQDDSADEKQDESTDTKQQESTVTKQEESADSKLDEESLDNTSKNDEKEEEWLDVLGNGLLKKKTVTKGQGRDTRPERGQEVTLDLETRSSDGTILEEMHSVTFILGDHEVPESLDMTISLMELGEKSEITSDAKYCYGDEGKPPNIEPGMDLCFTVILLNIDEGPYNTSVPVRKRLDWVDKNRNRGNQLYLKKKFFEASNVYLKCTRVLQQAAKQEQPDDTKAEIEMFSLKCHNNLAASYMMLEQWKEALQACRVAEGIDPRNVKTLFRKAKVLHQLGDLQRAIGALKIASQINPDDKSVQTELSKLTKKLSDQKSSQKKMYQRMLGNNSPPPKPEDKPSSSWTSTGLLVTGSLLAVGGAVLLGVFLSHR